MFVTAYIINVAEPSQHGRLQMFMTFNAESYDKRLLT